MKRKNGFTLVEMMIVVSVLGLILAIGTPPFIQFLRHYQSKDAAQIVMGVLRQARSRAIQEKNNYIVFFNLTNSQMVMVDDDGGGNGNPENPGYNSSNRGNGRADQGERVFGPYELPDGQVFGMIAGSVDPEGEYVTRPVTFSGNPPRVVFLPNGGTNEEGLVFVMPRTEFREQERGTDQMMIVRRSTGSVIRQRPKYD
ncbi:MAG: prepilin-type N-terminal cleavage/methylation domain-containing protein [bacterium]|nr:MAG: prepilin-type N-terminal cleavage/methylation domain-containing protein [bacterium]